MHLFDQLDAETLAKLEAIAEERRIPEGETIIRRGERSGDVYRLDSGSLEVVDGRSHPELILGVLGPGTVVGEVAFVDDSPRSANVRTAESSVLSIWHEDHLRRALDADAGFAACFYRALSRLMAERLRSSTRMASAGAPRRDSVEALSGDASSRARDLCEQLKQNLVDLETPLRRQDPREAMEALREAVNRFISRGARFFASLSHEESQAAGQVLARELHPFLMRSRLAELAIAGGARRAADPPVLAHVLIGRPEGSDPLGVALDRTLLDLDSAAGLRKLNKILCDRVLAALSDDGPARVLVVPCGAGALIASVEQTLALRGGELTCVDGDRDTLAFVDSGVAARPSGVRLRLVPEDLAALAMGTSQVFLGEQDVVILDGYTDYLPDRFVGSLARAVLGMLRPGGSVLVSFLGPTADAFIFDHLLGWRTVRRTTAALSGLFTEMGLEEIAVMKTSGAGRLLHLRRPRMDP